MICAVHPEREGTLFCQKTNRWFCEECGRHCLSPKTYCKFRTACILWALEHDKDGKFAADPVAPAPAIVSSERDPV